MEGFLKELFVQIVCGWKSKSAYKKGARCSQEFYFERGADWQATKNNPVFSRTIEGRGANVES
jgi:hypothetical protein